LKRNGAEIVQLGRGKKRKSVKGTGLKKEV